MHILCNYWSRRNQKEFYCSVGLCRYLTSTSHLCVLTSTCKAIVIFSKNYHPLWLIRSHSSIPLSPYSTSFYHTKYVRFLKIDGFEQDRRVVVIAATNRKEDLDPALIRCSFLLMRLFFYCKQSQIVWQFLFSCKSSLVFFFCCLFPVISMSNRLLTSQ